LEHGCSGGGGGEMTARENDVTLRWSGMHVGTAGPAYCVSAALIMTTC